MWQQGIRFIIKQLLTTIIISLFLVITGITAYASNTSSASHSKELISTFDTDDKYLGEVNLCDPQGTLCYTKSAYKDSENGRIYVLGFGGTYTRTYAQKSNDSRWEYMIRYDNNWYYFSF